MSQYLLAAILLLAPLVTGWALGNPETGDYKAVEGREVIIKTIILHFCHNL